MTARSSFLLCLTLSSIPFAIGLFGLYQLATLQPAAQLEVSALTGVCLLAYQRTVDTVGHAVIYSGTGLLVFFLASCVYTIGRGWQKTRRIRNIGTKFPDSAKWKIVEEFQERFLCSGRVELFAAPEPMALTIGYFSPRILISTGLLEILNRPELEAVLHHEAAHVTRRDPLRAFLSDACRTALPFVPIIRYVASQFDIKKELEADKAAIDALGSPGPIASALSKVIVALPVPKPDAGVGITATEARIDALLGKPTHVPARTLLVLCLLSVPAAVLLSSGFYFLAHAPHISEIHICNV